MISSILSVFFIYCFCKLSWNIIKKDILHIEEKSDNKKLEKYLYKKYYKKNKKKKKIKIEDKKEKENKITNLKLD